MRVDVIHERDPDSSCEIKVYVDGEAVVHHGWNFDPGSGWTINEFSEYRASALASAPPALVPALKQAFDEMERHLR